MALESKFGGTDVTAAPADAVIGGSNATAAKADVETIKTPSSRRLISASRH
jgi:hypothetical protein